MLNCVQLHPNWAGRSVGGVSVPLRIFPPPAPERNPSRRQRSASGSIGRGEDGNEDPLAEEREKGEEKEEVDPPEGGDGEEEDEDRMSAVVTCLSMTEDLLLYGTETGEVLTWHLHRECALLDHAILPRGTARGVGGGSDSDDDDGENNPVCRI